MFLHKLTIEHVRAIEDLELPLVGADKRTRKWTFLLSENGNGKTTILRAAALVLAGSEALPELLSRPDSWIRNGHNAARIQADLVTARGEPRTVHLELRRGESLLELFERNRESLKQLDDALRHTPRNYLTVGYGASRRLGDTTSGSAKGASSPFTRLRARSVGTLFSADAELNPLQSWAVDLHYRREEEGLRIVQEAMGHLLPLVEFDGIDRERGQLIFRTPDGLIPLELLSDGYQNMAAWCGDLLYTITQTFDDFDNPLAARGLLLIDEVDLHLHPTWQRQLKQFLDDKFPNFQIVATTHSPLTAQQAGEGELFYLKRPDDQSPPVIHHYEGAPRDLMVHQLITSPIFGLSSMDSARVEAMRERYRELERQESPSPAERRELQQLGAELRDLPDFYAQTPVGQRQTELLSKIEEALQTQQRS